MVDHSQDHHSEWSGVTSGYRLEGSKNCSLQPWQPAALGTNSPSAPSRVSFRKLHAVVTSNSTTRFFSIDRLPVSGVYLSSLSVLFYIRHHESRVVCSSFRSTAVPATSPKVPANNPSLFTESRTFPLRRDDCILCDRMEILAAVSLTSFPDTTTSSSSSLSETPASESPAYCFDSRMTPILSPTFPQ